MQTYSSQPKLEWRGWVWNRLQERIHGSLRRRDAVILYLVGPQDLDREVAIKKGFSNHNLIAVDLDQKYVNRVRKAGNLAICGRLEDIVAAWPDDFPLDGIVADFTCGLDKSLLEFQASLFASNAVQMGKTVIAVNLQRGRDPHSNPVRLAIQDSSNTRFGRANIAQLPAKPQYWGDELVQIITDKLHRGRQCFSVFLHHCRESAPPEAARQIKYAEVFLHQTKPEFFSYRQREGMPFMDSVVFTMPQGIRSSFVAMMLIYQNFVKRDPIELYKGKIAALRAVRTMRLEGIR